MSDRKGTRELQRPWRTRITCRNKSCVGHLHSRHIYTEFTHGVLGEFSNVHATKDRRNLARPAAGRITQLQYPIAIRAERYDRTILTDRCVAGCRQGIQVLQPASDESTVFGVLFG